MITDCRPLMRQLARMANMPEAGIRRMILVLDIDAVPKLYVDSFLRGQEEELVETEVTSEPLVVDTTTFLNENIRTATLMKLPDCMQCGGTDGSHRLSCPLRKKIINGD